MPSLDPSLVQVTPVVFDFLFVNIKDPSLENNLVQYIITGQDDQLIRKGNFKGLMVQLRMNFLKPGHYKLELIPERFDPLIFSFEKKNAEDSEGMVIKVY